MFVRDRSEGTQRRRPCERKGWSDTATNQGHTELPEARTGKEGFSTRRTFSRKMAVPATLI